MERFIQGIHYELSNSAQEFIRKKLQKLEFLKDDITDFKMNVFHEKSGYTVKIDTHTKWGGNTHFECGSSKLYKAISQAVDKTVKKIKKEKEKIAEHK